MATNANQVFYSGGSLSYIGVTPNQTLDIILAEINTAVNNMSSAPNYSGYSLGCVRTQVGTINTTQQFAEGISSLFCTLQTSYNTFTGTTYVSDQNTVTTAINGLQDPALTYAPFSITSADNIGTVYSKMFAGFTAITASITPAAANWSTIGASSQSTIVGGFNAGISYMSGLNTAISGKQATIGTFNATSIGGGATDSITTTVNELITYAAGLPVFANGSITYGGVSAGTNLQSAVQNTINSVNSLLQYDVRGVGAGLTYTSIGTTYQGYKVAIDTTWSGLYKVALNSGDVANNDYLANKVESTDSSITIAVDGATNKLNFTITNPTNNKVLVNSSDTVPGYLSDKITSLAGDWGMGIAVSVNPGNNQLNLTPIIINPSLLVSNIISFISSDSTSLAAFCALNSQCSGTTCTAPSALSVSQNGSVFTLTWTASGTAISQNTKYRQRGYSDWITDNNISPKNPETNSATTSTVSNLIVNTVYQFQVDSLCTSGANSSNMYESIIYSCQPITAVSNGGRVSVNQNPLLTIDSITYQLVNSSSVVVETQSATGANPEATFGSHPSGTYSVKYRYGTLINGVTLYSDDASQLNALCSHSNVII